MLNIMDSQGDKLNKWTFVPVDYFTRENDWADYGEFVRRPVVDVLDYSDKAVEDIYNASAGNPYFTNLLCQTIFRSAVSKKDCDVTEAEVELAIEATVRETERNAFQHFWEDGVLDVGGPAAERSIRRRRVLIALADSLAKQTPCFASEVKAHALVRDVAVAVDAELRELVTRKILNGDRTLGIYDFKVPLFLRWLRGRGVQEIIATFAQWDEALNERRREEELKVTPGELVELAGRWGAYRGQTIGELKIQAWLEQSI